MPTLDSTTIFIAFVVTLIAHIGAKYVLRYINKYFRGIPMIIIAIVLTLIIIAVIQLPYNTYYAHAKPVFDRLLGYSTVLLAVPLAGMDFKGLPVKKLSIIVVMASLVGAIVPMSLAYVFSLNIQTILGFATRSVTTPVGLSVAQIIDAPLVLANLIIIVSGIWGRGYAVFCSKTSQTTEQKAWHWVWLLTPLVRSKHGQSAPPQGDTPPLGLPSMAW